MRPIRIAQAALAAAFAVAAADALAFNCYEVIDKDQTVVYRATRPPFGMDGADWTKGQADLRAKGHHLRWASANDCSPQITGIKKAEATTRTGEVFFDPNVILASTPEYMTASGRPSGSSYGR